MDGTLRRALYDFGTLVKVYAALPALSIGVALAWGEFYAVPAFAITAAAAFGLGLGFERLFTTPEDPDALSSGVITVSIGWFVAGLLSALPLAALAWTVRLAPPVVAVPEMTGSLETFLTPLDAAFEGMSGVTGTGFSMASNPDELPRSLQWWRSLLQWTGGIGVIVLAAAFASSEESDSFSAIHGNMAPTESIRSTTRGTAAALWWLLALLTVVSALWLWLVGMGPWAALNHAMTGVTTGGFTITASSIESYDDPVIELALLPVMIVGATSFSLLFFLFRGDLDKIRGGTNRRCGCSERSRSARSRLSPRSRPSVRIRGPPTRSATASSSSFRDSLPPACRAKRTSATRGPLRACSPSPPRCSSAVPRGRPPAE